ncbi:MAG: hypothetical protein ACKOLZ_06295 [Verrucomicrobiota bacterium]
MRILLTAALAAALAVITPASLEAQKKPTKEPSPLARSEAIMLPKVTFIELRLDDVARQLTELSAKADPSGKGVTVVYAGPKDDVPAFSTDMTNVSLSHFLRILTQSVGYRTSVKDGTVLLEPR